MANDCQICKDFTSPYSVGFMEQTVFVCSCGNRKKVYHHPAIYMGNINNVHVLIVPFPGCTVCGRPSNSPVNFYYGCQGEEDLSIQMREVYHNDGLRN